MPVTSHDVAKLAGVSQPTVSRALRGDPRVSDATKKRVREAAALLGYVPSEAGRALSSGRTRRIGLLVTDLGNQFYAHVIGPAHHELERLGYQLMLHTESGDDDGVAERLMATGVDGVILATSTVDSVIPLRLRDRGVPFVFFNRTTGVVTADSTIVSPEVGFDAAVDAAVALGHRRFGAIFGPANTSTAQSREAALRAALARHGLSLDPRHVRRGPFETEVGDRATEELLRADDVPSIIFCGNDIVAYGVLNAARREGVSVPEELSVVGFDDLPAASWPIIRLSTIAFDLAGMARAAAGLVVERIEHPGRDVQRLTFSTSFVDRDTLGPASA